MRKYIILLTSLILLFIAPAHAQLKFGIKVGAGPNTLGFNYTNEAEELETILGFTGHIGFVFDIPLNERLSLRPELLYSIKGTWIDLENELPKRGLTYLEGYKFIGLYYLEAPVSVVAKLTKNIQIHAGPYFSVLGGAEYIEDYTYRNNFTLQERTEDFSFFIETSTGDIESGYSFQDLEDFEAINQYDYGLNVGLGYQMKRWLFDLNYSRGLNNLTLTEASLNPKDYRTYNENLSLSCAFFFGKF